MSTFEEDMFYRRLCLLLTQQMQESDDSDVIGHLKWAQKRLEKIVNGRRVESDSPCYHLFMDICHCLSVCSDWRLRQAVTFLMIKKRDNSLPFESRFGRIEYDFADFLRKRRACLYAWLVYREICPWEPPWLNADESAHLEPLIRDISDKMARPGFTPSRQDAEKLPEVIKALEQLFCQLSTAMPELIGKDLTEPSRTGFGDIMLKLLDLLELERLTMSGNDRLDSIIAELRTLSKS